jgi:hypothetical protein
LYRHAIRRPGTGLNTPPIKPECCAAGERFPQRIVGIARRINPKIKQLSHHGGNGEKPSPEWNLLPNEINVSPNHDIRK